MIIFNLVFTLIKSIMTESILNFWFNNQKSWMLMKGKKRDEFDKIINQKFSKILNIYEASSFNEIISEKEVTKIIEIILCLDQFSRHIYRENNCNKIKINTAKAVKISIHLINNHFDLIMNINHNYMIFILMTMKHINILKYMPIMMQVFERIENFSSLDKTLINKFKQDSLKKYLDNIDLNKIVVSDGCISYYNDKQIKEVCEFYPQMKEFTDSIDNKSILYDTLKQYHNKFAESKKVIISLSGGPDSMVLAYLLKKLSIHSSNKFIVEAIHINYKNRNQSDIEQEMICNFCKFHDIKLFTVSIPFIRRNNIQRDFYEKETRKLRFNIYKTFNAPIILGHIREDLIENIWTNISKGNSLFNLHKISEIDIIEGIVIFRPFCRINKTEIFKYAHANNIPYLKDTTPDWSNRGRMRKQFIPASHKQFGDTIDIKIIEMSDNLKAYKRLIDSKILKPFYDSITNIDSGLKCNIEDVIDLDIAIWDDILTKLFHMVNVSKPSLKSIKNYRDMLQRHKEGVINFNKLTYCYLEKNTLYIFNRQKLYNKFSMTIFKSSHWKFIKKNMNI